MNTEHEDVLKTVVLREIGWILILILFSLSPEIIATLIKLPAVLLVVMILTIMILCIKYVAGD